MTCRLDDFAFPDAVNDTAPGLTKREYFAAVALQGLLMLNRETSFQSDAKDAVTSADCLIEELNRERNL